MSLAPVNKTTPYHAFWSDKARERHGDVIYVNEKGKKVKATAVFRKKEDGEQTYNFQDKEYVGIVFKCVRSYSFISL